MKVYKQYSWIKCYLDSTFSKQIQPIKFVGVVLQKSKEYSSYTGHRITVTDLNLGNNLGLLESSTS